MAAKTYRVMVAKGEQQFEAEGDKQFVLDMLHRFEATDEKILVSPNLSKQVKPSAKTLAQASIPGKKMSVGEFIRQLGFKKHTDLVLAFGYYLVVGAFGPYTNPNTVLRHRIIYHHHRRIPSAYRGRNLQPWHSSFPKVLTSLRQ